jgi:hypothetical protein
LDVNYNKFKQSDVDKQELVIYQHRLYQITGCDIDNSITDEYEKIKSLSITPVYDFSDNNSP